MTYFHKYKKRFDSNPVPIRFRLNLNTLKSSLMNEKTTCDELNFLIPKSCQFSTWKHVGNTSEPNRFFIDFLFQCRVGIEAIFYRELRITTILRMHINLIVWNLLNCYRQKIYTHRNLLLKQKKKKPFEVKGIFLLK